MKKQLLVALAAIGMVACQQNEVVEMPKSEAIAFGDAFVGNMTRANDPSIKNLTAFNAYAFMGDVANEVFNGDVVRLVDNKWTYEGEKYWTPGQTYYFAGLAPVDGNWDLDTQSAGVTGAGSLSFTNEYGTEDLIYAATSVSTPATQKELLNNGMSAVNLTFNHLLSKVKFTFKNTFETNDVDVYVTNVKLSAPKAGTINLTGNWWEGQKWVSSESVDLAFGNVVTLAKGAEAEADNERLTIPAGEDYVYTVTFDLEVKMGATVIAEKATRTSIVKGIALEMGKAYNFVAELNEQNVDVNIADRPIEFGVIEVKDWDTTPADKEFNNSLQDMINNKSVVTLEEDYVLEEPLVIPAGKEVVLDLNGKTIKNTTPSEVFGEGEGIIAYGKLTINGNGTVEGSTMAVWARGNNGAKVTINGGTYKGCAGAYEGGRAVIYASSGNVIDIYGGTFEALAEDETSFAKPEYPVLNVADNNGMINVYGGTFVGQNPAAPGTEPAAWNAAHPNGFVAEGYKSTEDNGKWTVSYDAATSTADLQKRINDGQAHIYLAAGTTFEGTVYMKSNITLEGLEDATMHSIHLNGASNVTIKNVTFEAAGATMAYSLRSETGTAIRNANILTGNKEVNEKTHAARNITIEGCTFQGNLKEGATAIAFTDQGRKSGYSGNITIKKCTFNTKGVGYDIYGYYCGYENFVIEDNTFSSEFAQGGHIFLGSYASATPIVVKYNIFEKVSTLGDAMYTTSNSTHAVTTDASDNTFAN